MEQDKIGATLPVGGKKLPAVSNKITEKEDGEGLRNSSPATPVSVYLRAIQTVDGEGDMTELFTHGTVYQKNGKYYLVYQEPAEEDEQETITTLKMEGENKISLTRRGGTRSSLVIERGARNVGFYSTIQGNFTIGISSAVIKVEMTPTGGSIYFKYALDINTAYVSDHEVLIELVPQKSLPWAQKNE